MRATLVLAVGLVGCLGGGSGDGGGEAGGDGDATPRGGDGDLGAAGGGCTPRCGNLECGEDPVCGEPCGACRAGFDCSGGACIATVQPQVNGATCSHESECASQNCGVSVSGEGRCYGDGVGGDTCGDVFDCNGGLCLPAGLRQSSAAVCSDTFVIECVNAEVPGACQDLSLATCQFEQECGFPRSEFEPCLRSTCRTAQSYTPGECTELLGYLASGQVPCP